MIFEAMARAAIEGHGFESDDSSPLSGHPFYGLSGGAGTLLAPEFGAALVTAGADDRTVERVWYILKEFDEVVDENQTLAIARARKKIVGLTKGERMFLASYLKATRGLFVDPNEEESEEAPTVAAPSFVVGGQPNRGSATDGTRIEPPSRTTRGPETVSRGKLTSETPKLDFPKPPHDTEDVVGDLIKEKTAKPVSNVDTPPPSKPEGAVASNAPVPKQASVTIGSAEHLALIAKRADGGHHGGSGHGPRGGGGGHAGGGGNDSDHGEKGVGLWHVLGSIAVVVILCGGFLWFLGWIVS